MVLDRLLQRIIFAFIRVVTAQRSWADKLTFLFELENRLYQLEGKTAIQYGNGVHPKHRLIKYHSFFKANIKAGESILDVGCGNGELAFDIVEAVQGSTLVGVDINKDKIATASRSYVHPNLTFMTGDILAIEELGNYDVVILSNVLEHIEKRVEFLAGIVNKTCPDRVLMRVPLFEREWRVPLKKELGVEYRLDKTHFIEYTMQEFEDEIQQAGLMISASLLCWGELWCVAKRVGT